MITMVCQKYKTKLIYTGDKKWNLKMYCKDKLQIDIAKGGFPQNSMNCKLI